MAALNFSNGIDSRITTPPLEPPSSTALNMPSPLQQQVQHPPFKRNVRSTVLAHPSTAVWSTTSFSPAASTFIMTVPCPSRNAVPVPRRYIFTAPWPAQHILHGLHSAPADTTTSPADAIHAPCWQYKPSAPPAVSMARSTGTTLAGRFGVRPTMAGSSALLVKIVLHCPSPLIYRLHEHA
eukprot:CAMPEP_0171845954 /NCGR_PEP_ID=MMETSP0992-20121227/17426_1 /TAXON_ID=483369 /ORGANISM="non described non described, Strain CCMP2098" /LENGTH=180 /DNA_ID=CAMNT_0012464147 /DNA_START=262 /DNA_END=804 /DNA_ORIENTATION=-